MFSLALTICKSFAFFLFHHSALILLYCVSEMMHCNSKESKGESKGQESIQLNTTTDPGHHKGR